MGGNAYLIHSGSLTKQLGAIRRAVELTSKRVCDWRRKCIQHKTYVVLALLILFHVLSNAYIVSTASARNPPSGVASFSLDSSLRMYRELREGHIMAALKISNIYGPFYFFLTQPFYLLFGRSVLSASLLQSMFFAVLMVSAFLIGRELSSDNTGLLAAFLISFYPQIYGMSRVYMYDFGMTAMICLDLYLLVKTKGFTDKRFSILLGIALGASALIKIGFIIFLVGPLIAVFLNSFRFDISDRTTLKKMMNVLCLLFISLLIYSSVNLRGQNLADVLKGQWLGISQDAPGGEMYPFWHQDIFWQLDNALHWPRVMMNYQLLYFFGTLFVVAMGWLILSKAIPPVVKQVLISFLAIPVFFFTFILLYTKGPRFILPLAIGISLVSALFVMSIRQATLRRLLIAAVIFVGLWQYWALCYASLDYSSNQEGFTQDYFSAFHYFRFTDEWINGMFRPPPESSGLKEAADILIEDSRTLDPRPTVVGALKFFIPFFHLRHLGDSPPFPFYMDNLTVVPPEDYNRAPDYFLQMGMPQSGESCQEIVGVMDSESIRRFEEQRDRYVLVASIPSFPCATAYSRGENYSIDIYKRIVVG